jgi:HSP20 family molecular chaperone IbpA
MLEQTFGGPGLPSQLADAGWSPLVDIEKTDDSYVVEAELPGNLENGVLSLRVPKAERAQRRQIEVKA